MRTGSNLLEERVNMVPGLKSYGEVFNPAFVGHANQPTLFGFGTAEAASDPAGLIARLQSECDGLPGFRLFPDHNAQALQLCLDNPRCAKIILTRNPVDSFVSLEIVRKTDQWRLNDLKNARKAKITFDPVAFTTYRAGLAAFYGQIEEHLQRSGQAAFRVRYSDLWSDDAVTGLARFLGQADVKELPPPKVRKQNPEPLSEKVTNFPELVTHLGQQDPYQLFDEPSFEPARGPNVPAFIAHRRHKLLFMPIQSGPTQGVKKWLSALPGSGDEPLEDGLTQKGLRQWKRRNNGHLAFTVVRHPVARALEAYVAHFASDGDAHYPVIREALINQYKIPLPEPAPLTKLTAGQLREPFLAFLQFLRGNLAGQSSVRIDGAWASQTAILQAMASVAPPMHVFREPDLAGGLAYVAETLGLSAAPYREEAFLGALLQDLYDDEVEARVRAAYQRDYMMFGFSAWGDHAA